MTDSRHGILRQFRASRIALPLFIGLGIVGYMLYSDMVSQEKDIQAALGRIQWSPRTFLWIGAGLLMMVIRDLAYMWQLRILTNSHMNWTACFQVVMLWEFFAAVSPSIVGGAALAIFMLIKEKLSVGRSTAIIFTTIFLDEVFYLMILPVVVPIVGLEEIFSPLRAVKYHLVGTSMVAGFWLAYGITFAYVVFLALSLFILPTATNKWFKLLFMQPFLKRWRRWGLKTANELLISSRELRDRSNAFWFQCWAATTTAWVARYLILNCVLAAFAVAPMGIYDHLVAFSRQAVLFVVMIVSPTPGSSGIAEAVFTWMFADYTPKGLSLALATQWRLISYYPYLIVGIPIMHRWVKRVYGKDII